MKKDYTQPEVQIRKYDLSENIFTGMISNITDGGTWDEPETYADTDYFN